MPSKRYIITAIPIEHINGKMANGNIVCKNKEGGGTNDGFYYGYRKGYSLVNRYGIRTESRNLTDKPYSQAELDAQTLFTTSSKQTKTVYHTLTIYIAAQTEFYAQNKYKTLYGYIFSEIYKNSGVIPPRWTT